jgi:mannosyltransferase OCH1-like enzyme
VIPRILHQAWLGDAPFPERYQAFYQRWRALHPDWEYVRWRDELVPSEAKPLVDAAVTLATKTAVLRIHALLRLGGVYVDTDVEFNHPLDPLLDQRAFVCATPRGVSNSVIGCEPGHPVFEWVWDRLPDYAAKPPPWGPQLLTDAVEANPGTITVLPQATFFPFDWDEKDKRPARHYPSSIAVHHADHTWRPA